MTGRITVFGGTGFIGRHLVALLLPSGATVRVAVRHPSRVPVATNLVKHRSLSKPMHLTTSLSATQSRARMPSSI